MTTGPRSLRHGTRRLRNAPGFTVTAILTLTLGLGALGTVFTVVDGSCFDRCRIRSRIVSCPALPGVSHAAAVSKLPLDDQGRADSAVFLADRPLAPGTLPSGWRSASLARLP